MACNHPPPPPPPFERDTSVPPAPPPTPIRAENLPKLNGIETDPQEEFTFPALQEVFVEHFLFPAFKVAAEVDFDEESVGDISLNDVSEDDEENEGENGNGTKACPNENGTKPPA